MTPKQEGREKRGDGGRLGGGSVSGWGESMWWRWGTFVEENVEGRVREVGRGSGGLGGEDMNWRGEGGSQFHVH